MSGPVNVETPIEPAGDADADAEHIRARAAWYYYVGGLTQQEIADRLGITRLRINKIIGQARADGSVRIDIRLPLASCVALEERLKERFGLVDARVVPTVPQDGEQQRVIGEAAGAMLNGLLLDGQALGVGWGRTLSAAAKRITGRRASKGYVATLMGGLTRGSGVNTFEVSTDFARLLGAECYYLAAPIYFPSAEAREALLVHYGIAEALNRARKVDVAFVSCGDLSNRSLLARTHIVTENMPGLTAAGAIGDFLGVFLDEGGQPVGHSLNQRVLALSSRELKAIPHSILASGGLHKVGIVKAVLQGGFVNRVVTDEACAEGILA